MPTELLKHADTAMYQAKAMGRHTYEVYSDSMDEKNRHRAILASALRRAIDRNELSLVFQPRLSISRQRITGVEALLRWDSKEFGMVSPAQFIPLAEESGMILELGAWALRNACMTLREWHDAGLEELSVAVNVSATQLQRGDLQTVVARTLQETGVPANRKSDQYVLASRPDELTECTAPCDTPFSFGEFTGHGADLGLGPVRSAFST